MWQVLSGYYLWRFCDIVPPLILQRIQILNYTYSIRGYLQFSIAGLPLVRAGQLIGKMYGVRGFEILL